MTVTGFKNDLLGSLEEVINRRRANGLFRSLYLPSQDAVDFCSNDYLGVARSKEFEEAVSVSYDKVQGSCRLGSTGSRLLTGNSEYYEQVEEYLKNFHSGESALLFNSGYDCNLGIISSLPQPGDWVVYDDLVHNSIREGLKLSRGRAVKFAHNDVKDLEQVLLNIRQGVIDDENKTKNIIVSVESVYSMDGHCAPLGEMVTICKKFGANLVVDEAHGIGVFGEQGRGWCNELNVEADVFARVYTFGKAMGAHGAVVIGPRILRDYLINYARPLIYSTALPLHTLVTISESYKFCEKYANVRQKYLRELVKVFRQRVKSSKVVGQSFEDDEGDEVSSLNSMSPIQGIVIPGNENVVRVSKLLQASGFDVKPIRSPTVPAGSERLRIIIHYYNTEEEIETLLDCIEKLS
mmetsp:Transcript_16515/g.20037  ORF Transcript_16515/g.20037 Transcript_16515/m.20037 type:complete len:408 (-) Transcript_16515:48-1271(-)